MTECSALGLEEEGTTGVDGMSERLREWCYRQQRSKGSQVWSIRSQSHSFKHASDQKRPPGAKKAGKNSGGKGVVEGEQVKRV